MKSPREWAKECIRRYGYGVNHQLIADVQADAANPDEYCDRTKTWLAVMGYTCLAEVRSALQVKNQDPIVLCLCEQDKIILKPNQPYIFRVDENCPSCIALNLAGKPKVVDNR